MTPVIDIELAVDTSGWPANANALVDRAINAAWAGLPEPPAVPVGVSVLLTNDEHQSALNARWRGLDKPTNVLSFPTAEPVLVPGKSDLGGPMGDISLALETLNREAAEQNKSFADHVTHMLVHGFLHLAGYDHCNQADANRMERLEIDILSGLAIANPYDDIVDQDIV